MPAEVYDGLIDCKDVFWFCESCSCEKQKVTVSGEDRVISLLQKMMDRLGAIEDRLSEKTDDEEMLTSDENDDSTDIHIPVDNVSTDDDDDDDDDDILYRLATSSDETDSYNSDAVSDTTVIDESDVDETDWKNILTPPSITGTAFDAVRVTPKKPFLLSEGPIDFFHQFFDDSVFDLMAEQTNLYAKQTKLRHWKDTSQDEMKAFIAILIGMGLHIVPNFDLYWSTDPLFRVQNIVNVMAIKRFKKLLQGFHLNDNAKTPKWGEDNYDKLYKVRPLIVKLKEHLTSKQLPQPHSQLMRE